MGIDDDIRPVEVVLEGALLHLGRCIDLVRPAGLLVSSVPEADWESALSALEHSMREIRTVCDPDRPLRPTEWGKIIDEEQNILDLSDKAGSGIFGSSHHDNDSEVVPIAAPNNSLDEH